MLNQQEETGRKEEISADNAKQKDLEKKGEDILIRLFSAFKTTQIYNPNNLIFQRQVNLLFGLIQETIQNEGDALFQIKETTLFFNTVRIKYDFSTYHSLKFIIDELTKREIGTIGFCQDLSEDELREFVILFPQTETDTENSYEDFLSKMKAAAISHISLEKIHPFETSLIQDERLEKKYVKKVFFKSITHLNEVFEKERQDKRIRIKTTRRLMQSIVGSIIHNESFMIGLTNLKNYNEYTLNHSINVCVLAVCMGRRLGLEKTELLDLGIAAFFHDIGKLDIPKEILEKPSKLNEEERKIIEKHPFLGAGKLVRLKELSYLPVRALYVALEHHLRTDLSGYPKCWKKNSINLFSQIVELCDFFDALTTKRPYREDVFTRNDALSLMLEKSGTDFDPLLLKVFSNMVGAYPIGTVVSLDTGELGIVTEPNPEVAFMLRPEVKLITDEMGNKIDGKSVKLTEMDANTNEYKRTIVKSLDPHKYNINVSEYFLAEAE